MNVAAATVAPEATSRKRIRVMIVDDAAVVRGLFARISPEKICATSGGVCTGS